MAFPELKVSPTIEYPTADGEPLAESDFRREPLIYAVEALSIYFADRPDVYVSGNLFIYYEEGNPAAVVAPDVFVVVGAEKRKRSAYFLWQEPKAPDFVLEITSRSTRGEDQGNKRGLYAYLGVQEYFQYDPTGDYLEPPLQGERLAGRNYVPIPAGAAPNGALSIRSETLGLDLRLEPEGELRFYDPATGRKLRTHREAETRIAELEARLRALEEDEE